MGEWGKGMRRIGFKARFKAYNQNGPLPLSAHQATNALPQLCTHLRDNVVEQKRVARKLLRHATAEARLQRCGVRCRHAVPALAVAKVHVVDGVEEVVLYVPAERREQHADVHPGHGDACGRKGGLGLGTKSV